MYKPAKGSKGHKAFSHIYAASVHAFSGRLDQATKHIEAAHEHVGNHVKELTTSGKHTEAKEFNAQAQDMLLKLDGIMKHKSKFKKSERLAKMGSGTNKTPNPSRWQSGKTAYPNEKQKINHNPGQDRRYDYKPIHQMNPSDQTKAAHAFGEKDMQSFHYPHDKKTGDFVHGTRWRAPESKAAAPRANEPFPPISPTMGKIPPQHKPGAGIRIKQDGHEHHNKLGIVQQPNPSMPGKIAVRIQTKGMFQNVFMEPHQVQLSKLATMNKAETRVAAKNVVLMCKSRHTLARLRKKG